MAMNILSGTSIRNKLLVTSIGLSVRSFLRVEHFHDNSCRYPLPIIIFKIAFLCVKGQQVGHPFQVLVTDTFLVWFMGLLVLTHLEAFSNSFICWSRAATYCVQHNKKIEIVHTIVCLQRTHLCKFPFLT